MVNIIGPTSCNLPKLMVLFFKPEVCILSILNRPIAHNELSLGTVPTKLQPILKVQLVEF